MKGADSDILFNCGLSRCIKKVSCNFNLKSLDPLAKTENSSKDTMLLQTNIWSSTAEFLVDLMLLPDSHMFRNTKLKVMFGFTIKSSIAATTLKLVTK